MVFGLWMGGLGQQDAKAYREWRCYSATHGWQYHAFGASQSCWAVNNNEDIGLYAFWQAYRTSGVDGGGSASGCTGVHGGQGYGVPAGAFQVLAGGPWGGARSASSIWLALWGVGTGTCRTNHLGSANCTASSIRRCLWSGVSRQMAAGTWWDTTNRAAGNQGDLYRTEFGGDTGMAERGAYIFNLRIFDSATTPTNLNPSAPDPGWNTGDAWDVNVGAWSSITNAGDYQLQYCAGWGCSGWATPTPCTTNGFNDQFGNVGSTSTTCWNLPDYQYYSFRVRACSGGVSAGTCSVPGPFGYYSNYWLADRTAPATCAITAASDSTLYTWTSGTTVYYNPSGNGAFSVTYTGTDLESGFSSINFQTFSGALTGFSAGGSDSVAPYVWNYSYTAGSPAGSQNPITAGNQPRCYDATGNYRDATSNVGVVRDDVSPTGMTATHTTGWSNTPNTDNTITYNTGTDATSGMSSASGWSHYIERGVATMTAGACGAYTWTTATSFAANASTASSYNDTTNLSNDTCVRWRINVYDNVGRMGTSTPPGDIRVDTTAPSSCAFSTSSDSSLYTYANGSTVYYSNIAAGSFVITYTGADAHSFASISFPALTGFTNITGSGSDAAAPYQVTYSTGATSTGSGAIAGTNRPTCYDTAGNSVAASTNYTITQDTAGPTGVAFTGSYASTYSTNTTGHTVTWTNGSDALSGLSGAAGARVTLTRRTGTLSAGACSAWTGYSALFTDDTAMPASYAQTLATGTCYQYQVTVKDNVQNPTTVTSGEIRVDTTVPTCALVGVTDSGNYTWVTGTTVYYSALAAGSTFTPQYNVTDTHSGAANVTFPALAGVFSGITGSGVDTTSTYTNTYTATAAGAGSEAPVATTNRPLCYDAAGNSAYAPTNYSITKDTTVPTGGSTSFTNGYTNNLTADNSITWTMGTDAAAGISSTSGWSHEIERGVATMTAGACGAYSWTSATSFTANASASSSYTDTTDLTDSRCYQWRLKYYDNVGNVAYSTPGSTLKTDVTAPSSCVYNALSEGTIYTHAVGSTIYYSNLGAGSYLLTYTGADNHSFYSIAFPALTAPYSNITGSGTDTAAAYQNTYSTGATSAGSGAVGGTNRPTCADEAGNTTIATTNYTITADTTGPTSVAFTGGYESTVNTSTVNHTVTWTNGSDAGSGLTAGSGANVTLERRTGTLSAGACSAWTGYSALFTGDGALPTGYAQTLSSNTCYQYRLTVDDNVQNPTQATSGEIRMDNTAPTCALVAVTDSGLYTWVTGTTVYYSALAAGSTFTPEYSVTDAASGPANVTFPALGGVFSNIAGSGVDTTSAYINVYTVSATGAGSEAPVATTNRPLCYDAAGNSAYAATNYGITKDTTAPTGGSTSFTNGYTNNLTADNSITWTMGTDAAAGISSTSGWSHEIERGVATLTAGACGAYAWSSATSFTANASASSSYTDTTDLTNSRCYQWRLKYYDNVGNVAYSTPTDTLKTDTTAPATCAFSSSTDSSATVYANGATIYYSNIAAGSYTVTYTGTDVHSFYSITFPVLSGIFSNITGSGTDVAAAYTNVYSTGTTSAGSGAIATTNRPTCADEAGNTLTATANYTLTQDTTGPAGTAFTGIYNSALVTTTTGHTITWTNGADATAGMATANGGSNTLERRTGTLSGGSCSAWTGYSALFTDDTALPTSYAQTLVSGTCYQYRLTAKDNVQNPTQATSGEIQVDTVAPTCTLVGVTESGLYTWVSGTTAYYSALAAGSTFTPEYSITDAASGADEVVYPALGVVFTNITGSGTDGTSPYTNVYTVTGTGNGSQAPVTTTNRPLCYDAAGNSAYAATNYGITKDTTAPTGGSTSFTNGYTNNLTADNSISWTMGTDAAAGISSTSGWSHEIERGVATLTAGACGAYAWSSATSFTANASASSSYTDTTDLTDSRCYQWRLKYYDNVGNVAYSTPTDTLKTDTTAPATCAFSSSTDSSATVYANGATIYYSNIAAGSYTVTYTGTDVHSFYSITFPVLSGIFSNITGSGTDVAAAYTNVYSTGTTSTGSGAIATTNRPTCADEAGNTLTATANYTLTRDTAGPTGTAFTGGYDNTVITATTGHTITWTNGTDATAGMATANGGSNTLERRTGTYSGGSCSAWTGYSALFTDDAALPSSYAQTLANGSCYQYRLTAKDNVQNPTQVTSGEIRIDTVTPTCAVASFSEVAGGTYIHTVATDTVYYNSGGTGTFNVSVSATAGGSGLQHVAFPALTNITGGGNDTTNPYHDDYDFTGTSTQNGTATITCLGNNGLSATDNIDVLRDVAGPTYTTLTVNDGTGADIDAQSSLTTMSANWTFVGLADALSGVARYDYRIVEVQGTCADYNGACGETDDTVIKTWTNNALGTTVTDATLTLTDGVEYAVQVRAVDNVENYSTIKATDGVFIDNTPPTCAFNAHAENPASNYLWVSTSQIFYNTAGAGASWRTTIDGTDGQSSVFVTYPSLTGITGSGNDTSSPFQSDGASTPGYTIAGGSTFSGATSAICENAVGLTASAAFTVTRDETVPTGGSTSFTNAYTNNLTADNTIAWTMGTDASSGISSASGWSHEIERGVATLTAGACGAYAWSSATTFTANASATGNYTDTTDLTNSRCYQWRLKYYDNVGNVAYSTPTDTLKTDTTAPATCVFSTSSDSSATVYANAGTIYYSNLAAGSYTVTYTGTDVHSFYSVAFPALTGIFTNITGSGTDVASPFTNTYSTGTTSTGSGAIATTNRPTCADEAGNTLTATTNYTLTLDTTGPTGMAFTAPYAATYETNTASHTITWTNGSDATAGLSSANGGSNTLERRVGTLSGASCSAWGGYTALYSDDTALPTGYAQTLTSGNCYQYRLTVKDNVQNPSQTTSGEIKVDSVPPTCALVDVTESGLYTWVTGTTVYYSALAAGSTFTPEYSVTDGTSGPGNVTFPALGGVFSNIAGSGVDTTSAYTNTYTVSATGAGSEAPIAGANRPLCYDAAGNSAYAPTNYSITKDTTVPTGGSTSFTNAYTNNLTADNTVAWTMGTDASSGISSASGWSHEIERGVATLTAGACGAYAWSSATTFTANASATGNYTDTTDLTNSRCYQWRLKYYDNVGNVAYSTPTDTLKTDTTAPATCAFVSAAESSATVHVTGGNTVWYSNIAAGSFTATYGGTDVHSFYSVAFPALTGVYSNITGSGTDVASPFTNTYSTGTTSAGSGTIATTNRPTCADEAGNTLVATTNYTLNADTTGPTGVAFTGVYSATYDTNNTAQTITWTNGSDADAGITANISSSNVTLERRVGSLTAGACGGYGGYSALFSGNDAMPVSYAQTLTSGNCYQYRLTVDDNVQNPTTVTSGEIRVDSLPPTCAIDSTSDSGLHTWSTGWAIYYSALAAGSTFTVTYTGIDEDTAFSHIAFPTLGGVFSNITGNGSDYTSPYSFTYTVTGTANGTESPIAGANRPVCYDTAGNSDFPGTNYFLRKDTTVPTGGGTSFTNGYTNNLTADNTIAWTMGTDADSGISSTSGWSHEIERGVATLTAGACGAYAWSSATSFTADASDTGNYTDTTNLTTDRCYQWRLKYYDNVGNVAYSTPTDTLKTDTTAPATCAFSSSTDGSLTVYANGATVYYSNIAAGSYTVTYTGTDVHSFYSITFPALTGIFSNITGSGTDPSAAYTNVYSTGTTSSGSGAIATTNRPTCSDEAGNTLTATANYTLTQDTVGPAGTAFTGVYNSALVTGTTAHTVTWDNGTDATAGMATANGGSTTLERRTGTLSGGSCSAWTGYSALFTDDTALPTSYAQVLANGTCYQYRLTAKDNVQNPTQVVSGEIQVDTVAPTCDVAQLNETTGAEYIHTLSTSTVYYNSGGAGTFNISVSATSGGSGLQHVNFPALTNITGGGNDTTNPYNDDYDFDGTSTQNGAATVTCLGNNGMTASDSVTILRDVVGPTYTSLTPIDGLGPDYEFQGSLTTLTASWSVVGLADATSGVQRYDVRFVEVQGCSDYTTGCVETNDIPLGTWLDNGMSTTITDNTLTLSNGYTYAVQVRAVDNVENYSTIKATDGVTVDATPPECTLTSISTTTNYAHYSSSVTAVYYQPGMTSSFNVLVNMSDSSPLYVDFPSIANMTGIGADNTNPYESLGAITPGYSVGVAATTSGTATATCYDTVGGTDTADFDYRADNIAPTGWAISYLDGAQTATTQTITIAPGTDNLTGSGVTDKFAGQVQLQQSVGDLSGGTCSGFSAYSTITNLGALSTSYDVGSLLDGKCYQYRVLVYDNVSNLLQVTGTEVTKIDNSAPVCLITGIVNDASLPYVFFGPSNTVFYNTEISGSLELAVTVSDSNPLKANFPAIGVGFTGTGDDSTSPFTSLGASTAGYAFLDTAVINGTNNTVTCYDISNQTDTENFIVDLDVTDPVGGSITYSDGFQASTSIHVDFVVGSDAESGIGSTVFERSTGTLSAGSCSAFGAWTPIAPSGATFHDDVVATGCYQYRLVVTDNVNNETIYDSTNVVKVDTSNPSCDIGISGVTESPDSLYQYVQSTTQLFYGVGTGAFNIEIDTTDAQSGIQNVTFPASVNLAGSGTDTTSPYMSQHAGSAAYSFTAATSFEGGITPTCTNQAGTTVASATTLAVSRDAVIPVLSGVIDGTVTDVDYQTDPNNLTFQWTVNDALSGVRESIVTLVEMNGTCIDYNGACGETDDSAITAPQSVSGSGTVGFTTSASLVLGETYAIRVISYDNVNNVTAIQASDGFIFDNQAPEVRITSKTDYSVLLAHNAAFYDDLSTSGSTANDDILRFTYKDHTDGNITLSYWVDTNDNCTADIAESTWETITSQAISSSVIANGTQVQYLWNLFGITPSANVILKAEATDAAGNTNNVAWSAGANTAVRCAAGGTGIALNYNTAPEVDITAVSNDLTESGSEYTTGATAPIFDRWVVSDSTPTIEWAYSDGADTAIATSQSQYQVELFNAAGYDSGCGGVPAYDSGIQTGTADEYTFTGGVTQGRYIARVTVWDSTGSYTPNHSGACNTSEDFIDSVMVDTSAPDYSIVAKYDSGGSALGDNTWHTDATPYFEVVYSASEDAATRSVVACDLVTNGANVANHGLGQEMFRTNDSTTHGTAERYDLPWEACDINVGGGTIAFSYSGSPLLEGQWEFRVTLRDDAGNETPKFFRYNLDLTPPSQPVAVIEDTNDIGVADNLAAYSGAQYAVRWEPSTDAGGIDYYEVQECEISGSAEVNFGIGVGDPCDVTDVNKVITLTASHPILGTSASRMIQITENYTVPFNPSSGSRDLENKRYLYRVRAKDLAGQSSNWSSFGVATTHGVAWSDASVDDTGGRAHDTCTSAMCWVGIVYENLDFIPNVNYAAFGTAGCNVLNGEVGTVTYGVSDKPASPGVNSAIRRVYQWVRSEDWAANVWHKCSAPGEEITAGFPAYSASNLTANFNYNMSCGYEPDGITPTTLSRSTYLVQLQAEDGLDFTSYINDPADETNAPKCVFDDVKPVTVFRAFQGGTNGLSDSAALTMVKSDWTQFPATTSNFAYYLNRSDMLAEGSTPASMSMVLQALVFDPQPSTVNPLDWVNDLSSSSNSGSNLGTTGATGPSTCDLAGIFGGAGYLVYNLNRGGTWDSPTSLLGAPITGTSLSVSCMDTTVPVNASTILGSAWSGIDNVNRNQANSGSSLITNAVLVTVRIAGLQDGDQLKFAARAKDRAGNIEGSDCAITELGTVACNDAMGGGSSNIIDSLIVDVTPPNSRPFITTSLISSPMAYADYSNSFASTFVNAGLYSPFDFVINPLSAATTSGCSTAGDYTPWVSPSCALIEEDGSSGVAGYVLKYASYAPPGGGSSYESHVLLNYLSASSTTWSTFDSTSFINAPTYMSTYLTSQVGTSRLVTGGSAAVSIDLCELHGDPDCDSTVSKASLQGHSYCFVAQAVDNAGNTQDMSNYLGVNEDLSAPPLDLYPNFTKSNNDQRWRERCITIGAPGVILDNFSIDIPGYWTNNQAEISIERVGGHQSGNLMNSWMMSRRRLGSPGF